MIVADGTADSPVDAGPDTVLHVRFAGSAAPTGVVSAMETFKALLRDQPGRDPGRDPRSVDVRSAPCRWSSARGVAYDAELLAESGAGLGTG